MMPSGGPRRQRGLRSRFDTLRFAEMLSFVVLGAQLLAYGVVFTPWLRGGAPGGWWSVLLALMSSALLQRFVASGYFRKAPATRSKGGPTLTGRLAIVTGANTGIGFETALDLARRGSRVILACRSAQRGNAAVERIKRLVPSASVCFAALDLESQKSVKDFVAALPQTVTEISSVPVSANTLSVDLLINNAGLYSDERRVTVDGVEFVLAVNHVSTFLLTELLLPALKRSTMPCRVINLGSVAQCVVTPLATAPTVKAALEASTTFAYRYYGLSKLCNVMHAQYLADTHGILACSVNPGGVLTEIFRNVPWIERLLFALGQSVLKTPFEGAQTTLHCCVAPAVTDAREAKAVPNGSASIIPGGFYADCRLRDDCRNPASCSAEEMQGFVDWSRRACGL